MPEGVSDLTLTLQDGRDAEVDWLSLTEQPRERYFVKPATGKTSPDSDGFIRRWLLLEPIDKPNRSNTVFTDSYLREHLYMTYYDGQDAMLPGDGRRPAAHVARDGEQPLQRETVPLCHGTGET